MDIKEQISIIQDKFGVSYKEARFMISNFIRNQYENGEITKKQWKEMKKIMKKELQ